MKSNQHSKEINLGRSKRVEGGLSEKAVVDKSSSLKGCVKSRCWEPQRGAEDDLAYEMCWVLKARRRYLMLWYKLLHWGKSSS